MASVMQEPSFGLMVFLFPANFQGAELGGAAATISDPCGFLSDISEVL